MSIASRQARALLELMDPGGQVVEVGLSLDEVKTLSQVLRKVTLVLGAQTLDDETTPSRPAPQVKAPGAGRRKRSGRFAR